MAKGCIQLSSRPSISNTVNQVPVNHVARVVVACALHPAKTPLGVAQVTSHPRLTFSNTYPHSKHTVTPSPKYPTRPGAPNSKAYAADSAPEKEQHALMPLYHFATSDLPGDTIAPEMDDTNAAISLRADAEFTGEDLSSGGYLDEGIMGNYLAYLAGIGFLPLPEEGKGKALPKVEISAEQKVALLRVGGRGALV
ncbi:hypothetical protein EYC84_006021 [Monilinia fructicola]|uniref:Uncharacterized protein n=1 Tax=Monilinia fructicola TaxID=38448 RepID=A0A5M9K3H4_MONFR|nr:hypothetical protein EYC84_006021 [Monilinia fructicola]